MPRGGARVGAGRKATGRNPRKKKGVQLYLLPEQIILLKEKAKEKALTVSDYVFSLVEKE